MYLNVHTKNIRNYESIIIIKIKIYIIIVHVVRWRFSICLNPLEIIRRMSVENRLG